MFKLPVCGIVSWQPRKLIRVFFAGIKIKALRDSVTCPRADRSQWQNWKQSPHLDPEPGLSSAHSLLPAHSWPSPLHSLLDAFGTQFPIRALLQHLETHPCGDCLTHKMYHYIKTKAELKIPGCVSKHTCLRLQTGPASCCNRTTGSLSPCTIL